MCNHLHLMSISLLHRRWITAGPLQVVAIISPQFLVRSVEAITYKEINDENEILFQAVKSEGERKRRARF